MKTIIERKLKFTTGIVSVSKLMLAVFTAILFLVPSTTSAQTCASNSRNPWDWPGNRHWFNSQFSGGLVGGGQLIDFQGGFSMTPLTQNIAQYEGTTAASTDQGNLVYICNGKYVWDAGGNITSSTIKEGDEQGGSNPLAGGRQVGSASQGVMSVRHPLNPNRFYVVAVGDVIGGGAPGVNYNVFDETGQEISGPTSLGVIPCEGIDATLHENGVDVWITILEYGETKFHSFLLTCDGIQTPGVISNVGDARTGDAGRGGLAFSPDGTKFAACFPSGWPNAAKQVSIYDFDKSTGKLSGRDNVAPTNLVLGPYDCIWTKDGSGVVVTGGNAGKAHIINATTGAATQIPGVSGMAHSVQIGQDGNYYFNGADGLFQWSGSGSATNVDDATGWGLPTIYIPPAEEPIITPVGPFCDTSDAVNLETIWMCSQVDAEISVETGTVDDGYFGPGIVAGDQGRIYGQFDPKIAGEGTHEIIFKKCAVDDTIWIEVKKCVTCIDTLKNYIPEICVGEKIMVDSLIKTSNGVGVWTIDSVPNTTTVDAVIDDSVIDTLFDASNLATKHGQYKLVYTVTETGQTCKDSIIIQVNPLPTPDLGNDTTICPESFGVTFGPGNYASYLWSTSETTPTIDTDTPGEYIVGVLDTKGCGWADTVVLSEFASPVVDLGPDTAICVGDADVVFDAGAGQSAYIWNSGASTNQTISVNTAGEYDVLITDGNGCIARDTVVLVVNALPVVTVNNDSICDGDPAATFTATSDSTAASYVWSDNGTGNAPSASGTTAGDYVVTVTDNNGCVSSGTGALLVNALPVVAVTSDTICIGDPDATFTSSSDSTAASWVWSGNGTGTAGTTTGGTAGDYTVTLTDVNGCVGSATGTLTVNALPVVTVNSEVICDGDPAATFTATSDSTAVSQVWADNGSGTDPTTTGTVAGDYSVTVTDNNGCIGSGTGTLTVNAVPVVTVNSETICDGDAAATFTATSDSTAASQVWLDNGTGTDPTTTGTVAGDYSVTVTDNNGCVGSGTGTLTVNALPVVTVNSETICVGDPDATFTATSDSTAASHVWSENGTGTDPTTSGGVAGNYTVTVTDNNGCIGSGTGTLSVNALPVVTVNSEAICETDPAATFTATSDSTGASYLWSANGTGGAATTTGTTAGDYTVTVTDNNGCVGTGTGVLTVNANPTPDVIFDGSVCPGSTTTLDVSSYDNGAGPFNYAWSTGASGSSVAVGGGAYHVDITDANGCTGRDLANITEESNLNVNIPGPINICEGESYELRSNYLAIDGYNFAWSPTGETTESITVTTSGTYDLHVDNGGGCQGDGSVTVVVNPMPLVTDGTASICSGQSANIGDDLGPGHTYDWLVIGGTNYNNTVTTGGVYTRVVTTSAGCVDRSTYTVTENSNPTVSLTGATVCEGVSVTLVDAALASGYSYSWSNGETTASISPTSSGTYTLTATDDVTGCSGSGGADVNFIAIPTVDLGPDTLTICEGEVTSANAQNANNNVLWSTGATTPEISMTTTGQYSVTVDNGTCQADDWVYVNVVGLPTSTLDKAIESQLICFEAIDSSLTLTAGTSTSYNYLWSTGETTGAINASAEGTYNVQISVGNCIINDQVTLTAYCPWTMYVPNAITPSNSSFGNDRFYAYGTNIQSFTMRIYDRWGLLIYKSDDIYDGWDGKYMGNPVQQDVYVYKINFEVETESGNLDKHYKTGTVTVIR